jgi:hypothetical protein
MEAVDLALVPAGAAVEGAVVAGAAALVAALLEEVLEAGGVAAGAADDELVLAEAFCTPPWPLQAPRPVALDVVPSLHVVGAAAGACAPALCMASVETRRTREGTISRGRL